MDDRRELTLAEIQQAIEQVDRQRMDLSLGVKERGLLELSALALRDAERLAIARLQKEVYKDMEQITARLNDLSKRIRTRVTRMNKVPKALDAIETVIKEVVKILVAVGKW
jgi:DNA repair exonuclease SbcCD ATPase subunit